MIPLFMVSITIILIRNKTSNIRDLIPGLLVFIIVALPIGIFIIINTVGINSIKLGLITIPRLPVSPRFETVTVLNNGSPIQGILSNAWTMLRLLALQSDGIIYNTVDPYGYFYKLTFPLAITGIVLLLHVKKIRLNNRMFLLSWLGASIFIGVIQPVNINRLNIAFIPIILTIAYCLIWLNNYYKLVLSVSICMFLTGFIFYTISYHGQAYRQQIDIKFHTGLLPALKFTRGFDDKPICVTDEINMPYIFALFSEQTNPEVYLSTIRYLDSQAPIRQVISYGRYTFGKQNCTGDKMFVYLLDATEIPPHLGNRYDFRFFDNFVVYYPKS
jgi:hypothetical protein